MFRQQRFDRQQEIWISRQEISTTPLMDYYRKLNAAADSFKFGDRVRAICEDYYCMDPSKGGRPGIDPEVYVKMLLIGFFEGIPSERGIATRCADSLAIRDFLGFDLSDETPHHSSLSVIRQRLDESVYKEMFGLVLEALRAHKLLKGRHIGIDASVIEANASMKSLRDRMTQEGYWDYVKRLASEAGIDPNNSEAVRRFDKNRPDRKTSNKTWENAHDTDAKIGKTKRGSTRMIYKPEHITDLETGAILDVDIRPGDEADTAELAAKLFSAEERVNEAFGADSDTKVFQSVTADKGYYKISEFPSLHDEGIRVIISDPIDNRRPEKLSKKERASLYKARRATRSKSGKALLKSRGMHLERSFAHVLDHGGMRQTTLRGRENILKRLWIATPA